MILKFTYKKRSDVELYLALSGRELSRRMPKILSKLGLSLSQPWHDYLSPSGHNTSPINLHLFFFFLSQH